eukprot:Skav219680  [mRNA]  locus=scaffold817:34619:38124:- [translate_table: standard]
MPPIFGHLDVSLHFVMQLGLVELLLAFGSCESSEEQMAYQTSLASRVEFLEKSLGDSATKHSQERMDFIENLLGDNVQKHSEVTVESRLKYLEQALGDSDAKHREERQWSDVELSHAHGKLEALHGRLGHLEAPDRVPL